jgi:hypothetical protein
MLRTLQRRPLLLALLQLSLPAVPAAGNHLALARLFCREILNNSRHLCFCSVLVAILFLIKHSDAAAPAPAPAVSAEYVPADKPISQMPQTLKLLLLALEFVSGFLFGSGLVVAGMVNPAKVWLLSNKMLSVRC